MMPKNQEKIHHVNGIKIGYTEKKITSYGGFSLLGMYFEKIELKQAIRNIMPITETSPNAMQPEEKIFGFFTLLLAGANRFSDLLYMGNPEIIRSVFGLKRLPFAGTTITRYFNKIKNWEQAESISEGLWNYIQPLINWTKISSDWLSFDSTVITRYGNQDGAKRGYNPQKRGRLSHHPLLAFTVSTPK